MIVPSFLECVCCLAMITLPLRASLHLWLLHQGRYLAISLQRTALHSINTIAPMMSNTILLPLDDLGVVGGNVCLDVQAGGVAHLDFLGVEDTVEWPRWREMLPDQTKEFSSHVCADIGRLWRIEPKNIPMSLLVSLLHQRLDVVQEGQLVSVARFLHCS